MMGYSIVAGVVILYALLVLATKPTISVKQKVDKGQFLGKLIYTDEKGGKLLVSERYDLQGKPDYIFQTPLGGKYVPYEIKSGTCKENEPHQGDLMQLVAYFLLVQDVYGKKPPFGKLVYNNKTFKVRNTRKLRRELVETLEEMRKMLQGKHHPAAEPSFIKCRNCICRETVCEWCDKKH